jgi:Subtilase family
MTFGFDCRRRSWRSVSLAALLVACLLPPSLASAKSRPAGAPELSPRLAELAQPEVRSLPPAAQSRKLGVSVDGPGSLLRRGGRVLADVRFDRGAIGALGELGDAGAEIVAPSRRYQTVTVAIAPGGLHRLAQVRGVESVNEKRAPVLFGVGAECEGGWTISEGVGQLHAATARSKHGVDGSGVTVGVLSDSYDQAAFAGDESGPIATRAAGDVGTSDLPGPANPCAGEKTDVNVLEDFSAPFASDEGRGMAQIVHDVAPGAELAFATAFTDELPFAENIRRLAKPLSEEGAEADVIVDDVVYFEEPFFQDGPVAIAVDEVAAEGIPYFSAAGNNNLLNEDGNEISSWEAAEFRDAETCPDPLLSLIPPGSAHCMDFDPNEEGPPDTTFAITVSPGATLNIDLQWAEPWFGVETDLNAYFFDLNGNLLAAEEHDNFATQKPVELPEWENTTGTPQIVRLVINRCAGTCNPEAGEEAPRLKVVLLQNGGGVTHTEYPTAASGDGAIFGHAAASGAVAVAAVPFNNDNQVESYSSRGPVTHYFEPAVDDEPADPLPAEETIAKPDLAATDCGATTFFSSLAGDGEWRFCGTSAAAPHAAAVAALQLEAEPAATVEEIRAAQTSTARLVGAFAPKAVGFGLLDADAAIAALLLPATIEITEHPTSRTADATPTFGFESSPPGGVEYKYTCSIDGVAPEPCGPGPYTPPTPLPDGPHTFEVEGVDVPGNAFFSFTVDTAPPTISFPQQPAAISTNTKPRFTFSSGEPASLTCSLDAATPKLCKSTQAVGQALADGPHSFTVAATDQVGNTGTATVDFEVDTRSPVVVLTGRPPPKSTDRTPTFAFAASEQVTFTCGVDGISQPCAPPFVTPFALDDGSHAFEVLAVDAAGNAGRASAQFAVDTRPPQTSFGSRPSALRLTRKRAVRVSFRFSADEPGAGFECQVDRGPMRPCPPRLARRFRLGKHVIRVKAHDELGNVDRSPAVFRFRVKRVR